MSRTINLGRGLNVDAHELATQVVAALGMRGSGKSNLMTVIIEGLLRHKVQAVILDYVGIHWGLRLQPDGKHPSPFQIPVLGGRQGDIAITPFGGRLLAESLASSRSPAVVDISEFSKNDRCRFATDFAEALFHAKKQHPGSLFLVLEEAQRFVPQKFFTGQERMLGAFEEIAEVGRNYGLGLGLISQRPQKINKDVLNLTELLFAFQSNGVLERKALAEWVQEKGADGRKEVNDELPGLERGEALVWSPSWLRIYGKYKFPLKSTFDAGKTPTHARAAVKMKRLDLDVLEASMAAVVEQAKADDPRALKAEIVKLQRELKAKPMTGAATKVVEKRVEVMVVPPGVHAAAKAAQKALEAANRRVRAFDAHVASISDSVNAATDALEHIMKVKERSGTAAAALPPQPSKALRDALALVQNARRREAVQPTPAPTQKPYVPGTTNGENREIPAAARKLLAAAIQRPGCTRSQLARLGAVKRKASTFRNALSWLNARDYVNVNGDTILVTPAGRALLPGADAPQAPTELRAVWRAKFGAAPRKMFDTFVEHGTLSRDELSEKTGIPREVSTFRNAFSMLHAAGVLERSDSGDDVWTLAEELRD